MMNPSSPLVSIALCTYNGEKFISRQIESLIHQTHKNLEIMVSDDCSQDHTLTIIKGYKDPRIKISINEKNIGLEANFFKAISLCSGQYIALSDQDDIWVPDKIEKLLNFMGNNVLVYGNSEFMNQDGVLSGKTLAHLRKMYSGSDNRAFVMPFVTCIFGHALIFDAKLIPKLFPFPAKYHDGWISFVAATHGSIQYLDEVLVYYRQHETSFTSLSGDKTQKKSLTQFIQNWFTHINLYPTNSNSIFFNTLKNLYQNSRTPKGALILIGFLMKHRKILFHTKPKLFSQINLIRKVFRKYY